jgi:hypothetical protein
MDIGDYSFDFVNEIEITSTWENLTDRCTIKVPKKLRIKKNGLFTDSITSGENAPWKRNDPVRIEAGYDFVHDVRFEGVLTSITPKVPLQFMCEDKMFLLKQHTITKDVINTVNRDTSLTLKKLLQYVLPNDSITGLPYVLDVDDFEMPKFQIITPLTVVELFNYLKKNPFGFTFYFQDGKLHAGTAYKLSALAEVAATDIKEFEFQRNIIDDTNLDYMRDDDVKLRVKVINRTPQNVITEYLYGDPDGELRTIQVYNLSASEVNKIGNEALQKYKYEGFRGSFTTFLQPIVKHGQAVKLVDPLIPDRNGVYLVRQVVTRIGMYGGRQEITLDRKIS